MKPERELAETSIDNSYNPPVLDLYCGKCGGFVEEMPLDSEIPYKDEVLCSDCQDDIDERKELRDKLMKSLEKRPVVENYVFNDRVLKILVPGFSVSTLNFDVINNNKILKIRGESPDFGTIAYNANIPKNTEKIKINVFNGILTAKFVEKEDNTIPIVYYDGYDEELKQIEENIKENIIR